MKTLPVDQIIVGERFRKVYENIPRLAESIKEKGLIHPLVVDSSYRLIVGGRRLQAAKVAAIGTVPVIIRGNLSELDIRELELEENIQREDLTWQEEVALKEEIDRLKKIKYGDKEADRSSVGWSMRDTARLLNESIGGTSQDIALSQAMKLIPTLGTAKTKSEAQKMLKSILADQATKELVERAKKDTKTVEAAGNDYTIGDAIEGLKLITPGVVGFADVDPDWGVGIWTDEAFYATGRSGIRYWFAHLKADWPLGTKLAKGASIGHTLPTDIGGGTHLHVGINIVPITGRHARYGRDGDGPNYTHGPYTLRTELERGR